MSLISYAQNHEDVLLDRAFPRGIPGMYIDIGAFDPVVNSVTKHFYDLGWHGINVEPTTHAFGLLCSARERDVNLNIGLSSEAGTLTLYEAEPECGLSTFEAHQAAWHRERGWEMAEREVPVRTLRDVCEEFVDGTIDFLSIDVEGHERGVLEGADWERWRPRVVLVEATEPGTSIPSYADWEPILVKADYLYATFDGLNRYYVRREDAHLAPAFAAPANVLDEYVPYAHHKQVGDLINALKSTQRGLAAARVANETLRAENASRSGEIGLLRAEQHRLDVLVAQTNGRYESAMGQLRDTRVLHDELEAEIRAVRAAMEALTADLGPSTVAVARALGRAARRVPAGAGALRTVRAVRRRLRSGAR